tara:strand:- start:64 stop:540 length:477 start_codon:yes stop_codon:yes gene_type:complete
MDLYNNIINLPFDFKKLDYERCPDPQFDISKKTLLGEMYNDKLDNNKNDLSHLNVKKWKNFAWCFYKLNPGHWIPPHVDHFKHYSKFYKIKDKSKIVRTLIFLEDWAPGHVFCTENNLILHWKANDGLTWKPTDIHWGGNFGNTERYTLQLTGIPAEN